METLAFLNKGAFFILRIRFTFLGDKISLLPSLTSKQSTYQAGKEINPYYALQTLTLIPELMHQPQKKPSNPKALFPRYRFICIKPDNNVSYTPDRE